MLRFVFQTIALLNIYRNPQNSSQSADGLRCKFIQVPSLSPGLACQSSASTPSGLPLVSRPASTSGVGSLYPTDPVDTSAGDWNSCPLPLRRRTGLQGAPFKCELAHQRPQEVRALNAEPVLPSGRQRWKAAPTLKTSCSATTSDFIC